MDRSIIENETLTDNESITMALKSLSASPELELVPGFCTNECGLSMWAFLGLLFLSVVASFASGIPSQQVFFYRNNFAFVRLCYVLFRLNNEL